MHILVTGSTGYVGRALVPHLASAGHTGVAIGRGPGLPMPPGWIYAQRSDFLNSNVEADWLVHLEVKQHVLAPAEKDLQEFEEVNVLGTAKWLDWCARSGLRRFIYFSSIKAVRPKNTTEPADELAHGPGDTPYGASKWKAEEIVRGWTAFQPLRQGLILRPSVIYGPGNQANVFAMVDAIHRKRFFLPNGGTNIKSLVSIGNVVAAVAHLISQAKPGSETYNLVDPTSYTLKEFSALVARGLGSTFSPPSIPAGLLAGPALAGDILSRLGLSLPLTSSRLKALLEQTWFTASKLEGTGFKHPEQTEAAVKHLAEWYLSRPATTKP